MSNEQVERVARAIWDKHRDHEADPEWGDGELHSNFENAYRDIARAAIAAMTPTPSGVHFRCNCVPELGPEHCHVCGDDEGRPVAWAESHATPDVGVLAEVRAGLALALENSDWWYVRDAINMIDREPTQ